MSIAVSNISALISALGFTAAPDGKGGCLVGRPGLAPVRVGEIALLQAINSYGADHLTGELVQRQIEFLGD